MTSCKLDLAATIDGQPYETYAAARSRCSLAYDTSITSWAALDYEAVKCLLKEHDDGEILHGDVVANRELTRSITGPGRRIIGVGGEEHVKLHRWFLRTLSPRWVTQYSNSALVPLIDAAFRRFESQGHAELFSDLASWLPARAIAAAMGLPWADDDWMEECVRLLGIVVRYFDRRFVYDDELIAEAQAAGAASDEMLMPFVTQRRAGQGEDLISKMWRELPREFPDWNQWDVLANVRTMFAAGTDTTNHAIANACYILATRPHVRAQVREGGNDVAVRLAEEVLRLYSSVHFVNRVVSTSETFEFAGRALRRGDSIVAVLASANRDPEHFQNPDALNIDRPLVRDHLAFGSGGRSCVGAALARAELRACITAVAVRLSDLRLDESQPPPEFLGFILRSYRPIFVTFEAQPRDLATGAAKGSQNH